jgi:hypothetical protein
MSLAQYGYVNFGKLLTDSQVADIRAYLDDKPCYRGYLPHHTNGVEHPLRLFDGGHSRFACYSMKTALETPHMINAATSPKVMETVHQWIPEPLVYSVNIFWTFPKQGVSGIQIFHRDYDDERFLAMFFYLTDNVAQRYISGSHLFDVQPTKQRSVNSVILEKHGDKMQTLSGEAGTAILMNPYGYHAGVNPESPRLLAWVRFGTCENQAYKNDKNRPIEADIPQDKKEIFRLLVKQEKAS